MKALLSLITIFYLSSGFAARSLESDILKFGLRPYINHRTTTLTAASENCVGDDFSVTGLDPVIKDAEMSMEYRIYRPLFPSKDDGIIIYPPTGGSTFIDEAFAEKFCEAGIKTIIMKSWPGSQIKGVVHVGAYDKLMIRGYYATLHAIDILGSKVGVFGMSLGGISAISAGILLPDKVKAVASVVAGLPLADVIASSEEEGMVKNREARMKEFNLKTRKEYKAYLQKNIRIEPLDYLDRVRIIPHRFYVADDDDKVPTAYQNKTINNFFNSETFFYSGGHLSTIFGVYMAEKEEMLDFFKQHLD